MAFQFPANPLVGDLFTPVSGVTYEFDGTGWINIGTALSSFLPSGLMFPYAGTVLPAGGWLWCNGATHLITDYPALYAVIGHLPGSPGGLSFITPDLRGRAPVGLDNLGGAAAAGRLTSAVTGIASTTVGGYGGAQTHTLTTAETAAHTHTGTSGIENANHIHMGTTGTVTANHTHSVGADNAPPTYGGVLNANGGAVVTSAITSTELADHTHPFTTSTELSDHYHLFTTDSTGGGSAHLNVQPTMVLNYIIKT